MKAGYDLLDGLPYAMVPAPFGSQKNNGYVGVPEGHPLYGKDYVEISLALPIDVHGGLTYAASHAPLQEPDGYWWFGFDLLHYDSPEFDPGDNFCMENIRLLAAQLASFDPIKLSKAPAEHEEAQS